MLRAAALAVLLGALPAHAQTGYPPITSRDYALDLHVATVIGSTRLVGMGGANIALVEQASGLGVNPAAPAVRAETANDSWEWDGGLSWLNPDLGDDFDNNGVSDGGAGTFLVTGGLAFQINRGGIGVELTLLSRDLPDVAETAFADTWILRAAVARSFADDQLTFGLGARGALFQIRSADRALVSAMGWSPTAGFLWRPRLGDVRVGVSAALPVRASVDACDDCGAVILPDAVRLPWELGAGIAWRFAPTRWNQRIRSQWRDERALVLALDLLLVGEVPRGHGVQQFIAGELQRSGEDVMLSVHAGGELEWIPGWLRLRLGGYWEPARLEGADGRIHATAGVEVRLFSFCALGARHRVRVSLTADYASGYGDGGLSLGFW